MEGWVGLNVECATTNQAPQFQADSQSGHGTSGPQETTELHTEDISDHELFTPQDLCFLLSIHKLLFFSVLEKYVSLVIVFCLMPKKCFPSHCCDLSLSHSVSLSVYRYPPSASLKWWEKSWSKNFCVCECCLVRQSQITRLWRVHMCLSVGAGTAIYIKEPRTSSAGAPSPP